LKQKAISSSSWAVFKREQKLFIKSAGWRKFFFVFCRGQQLCGCCGCGAL